jgi:hypothetical protein
MEIMDVFAVVYAGMIRLPLGVPDGTGADVLLAPGDGGVRTPQQESAGGSGEAVSGHEMAGENGSMTFYA